MLERVRKTVFNSLRPKNHFLAFLLCALVLPSVAVVLLAALALVSQERAMEAAVRSYVQDLAESTAYRLGSNVRLWEFPLEYLGDAARYNIFSWGPSIPGWVAHIGADGKIITASPGAMNIAAIWHDNLPIGTATRVEDKQGAQYTLAAGARGTSSPRSPGTSFWGGSSRRGACGRS